MTLFRLVGFSFTNIVSNTLLQSVVHELGHNLGMGHDFLDEVVFPATSNVIKASNGKVCTNVGGFMDYGQNPNQWSACSREDFINYWDEIYAQKGQFCLDPGEYS